MSAATLHGQHCYDGTTLVCGWPEQHTCFDPDCKRTVRPGWALCDDHAQRLTDRWLCIKPPEPQPDLPRWSPCADHISDFPENCPFCGPRSRVPA